LKIVILSLFFTLNIFAKTFNIALLSWSDSVAGMVSMREGVIEETDKINILAKETSKNLINLKVFIAGDGQEGMERQKKQILNLIDKDIDLFIIQPSDSAILSEPLKIINRKKIPIVTYDGYILDVEITSHLSSNNYQLGFLNGEFVANSFDSEKEIKLIMIEYPHVPQTVKRADGFLDALEHYRQKYKIIASYKSVNPTEGKKVAEKILKNFPKRDSIDVIFAINDSGSYPILEKLIEAKRDEIFFASIDGEKKMVKLIEDNSILKIDSAQFCKALGAIALKTSYQILNNERVPKYIKLPVFPITKETLHLYKGWSSDIPKEFIKPWSSDFPKWSGDLIYQK